MKSTHWAGNATPEALDQCLTHVFDFTREGLEWMADFSQHCHWTGYEQVGPLVDAFKGALRSYEDHKASLPASGRVHPADVCTSMSKSVIRLASEGAITEPEFLASWCVANFAKKFRYGCTMSDAEAKAGFIERNTRCSNPLRWDVRARMRKLLERALPPVNTEEGRFGPGATLERANTWPDKVKLMARIRGETRLFTWDAEALEVAPRYAKLHAVPKDFHRKRLITVEPLVVAWHQQAARSTILESVHRGSLRGTIMDQSMSDVQERENVTYMPTSWVKDPVVRQRARCIQGAQKGDLVTIDLSDASDTISMDAVSDVFPAWCMALLEKCRSPQIKDGGKTTDLRIYAGMGNATTFIVETLFFWALFTAVGELTHCGKPLVSVFGDDIVMNGKVARNPWFQDMIRASGILINWDKSGLSAGPGFREACGAVCYRNCYVPFTPRFYGYAGTREGAIGYCELCSRLLNTPNLLFKLFGLGLYTFKGKPEAPTLLVRDANEVGSAMAYVLDEWTQTRIPGFGALAGAYLPKRQEPTRTRYNSSLQRMEAYLYTSRAKTASLTLRDPVWGPGVSRSWGWWAYKLALLGQTTHDAVISRKSREIRYAIAHRTSVRRRWVPIGFLSRFG